MSVNSTVKAALDSVAPVKADTYEGDEAVYITFGYASVPANFADDAPGHERYLLSVHLYAPIGYNTIKERKAIKKALAGIAETYPSMVNASDKEGQHLVFECELVGEVGGE